MANPSDVKLEPNVEHPKPANLLLSLEAAFERGDYAAVRCGAAALAQHATDEERDAAQTLLNKTRPDPLVYVLFGVTSALLIGLTAYWKIASDHHPILAPTATPQQRR